MKEGESEQASSLVLFFILQEVEFETIGNIPWGDDSSSLCAPLNINILMTMFILNDAYELLPHNFAIACIDNNSSVGKIKHIYFYLPIFFICDFTILRN